jgi:hypothetical protein
VETGVETSFICKHYWRKSAWHSVNYAERRQFC